MSQRIRLTIRAGLLALLLVLPESLVYAEDPNAQLRVSRGPYHVGLPMELQVHVSGFNREPEPTCDAQEPKGGGLQFVALIPNVSTQITMVNGRTTRTESVTFICQYQFTPRNSGSHRFTPFRVTQGQLSVETTPYSIEAETLRPDPKLKLRVKLPDTPVFVGQQVPVAIEWWVDDRLQQSIQDYTIRSELFESPDTFRFLPPSQQSGGQQTLNVQTGRGPIQLPARAEERALGGDRYVVITSDRTLVPLEVGQFELDGATVNANEVTSWRRDLFGGRRPSAVRPIFAQDVGRTLVVKPPPVEGQPESFAGAIGEGFSFALETDRSVVQTGDPMVLTFTITGSGELDPVGLPDLATLLPPNRFRLPENEITGQVMGGTKAFRVPVRVLDENVSEIPSLPYSWFDPQLAEYQTTYSRPIALSVKAAQVVSANDVVSARPLMASEEVESDSGQEPSPQSRLRTTSRYEADLAIEIDRDRLSPENGLSDLALGTIYGLSVLWLTAAWIYTYRRDARPEETRRRALDKRRRQRIEEAKEKPSAEALSEITAVLRELVGSRSDAPSQEIDQFIASCDEILYSPDPTNRDAMVQERVQRALSLADEMIADTRKANQ